MVARDRIELSTLRLSVSRSAVEVFRLTSLRQGYGGPPKRYARRRKAEDRTRSHLGTPVMTKSASPANNVMTIITAMKV